MEHVELEDIQGIVAYSYLKRQCAEYVLLTIAAGRRADASKCLDGIRRWAASAARHSADQSRPVVAMAFTHAGLSALDVPADTLAEFVPEFRQSMPERARVLGDVDHNSPATWRWGRGPDDVHVLLAVYGRDPEDLADWVDTQIAAARGALQLQYRLAAAFRQDLREPFGFRDGISQPFVAAFGRSAPVADAPSNAVRAGEFVLGYPNQLGRLSLSPTLAADRDRHAHLPALASGRRDLGRNGTYLVVRELEQHVQRFKQLSQEQRAKVMGRWPSGAPLTLAPDREDASLAQRNDFQFFDKDRYGFRCPIGAHIRRANPRDGFADTELPMTPEESQASVNTHRLLRRGRPFREPTREGMFFMCVNANIERQFEFVQQSWLLSPSFMGLHGDQDFAAGTATTFTVPYCAGRERLPLQQYVSVRGGGYFFLPGLRALRWLLDG